MNYVLVASSCKDHEKWIVYVIKLKCATHGTLMAAQYIMMVA